MDSPAACSTRVVALSQCLSFIDRCIDFAFCHVCVCASLSFLRFPWKKKKEMRELIDMNSANRSSSCAVPFLAEDLVPAVPDTRVRQRQQKKRKMMTTDCNHVDMILKKETTA